MTNEFETLEAQEMLETAETFEEVETAEEQIEEETSETETQEAESEEPQDEPEDEVQEEQPKLQPAEIFKSKAAFYDEMVNKPMPLEICEIMQEYPKKPAVRIAELTQNIETLINTIGDEDFDTNQYLVWIVSNPKDKVVNTVKRLNGKDGLGIFIVKAYILNDVNIGFECLLKPELKEKVKRTVNTETAAKQLQKEYWETYKAVSDELQSEIQILEALPRHYQPVSIGVKGVQIMQTVNTQKHYIASEIGINNDKALFEKLLEHKEEIESEIGTLEWDSKETNKSAKVRKTYLIDINNPENHAQAAAEHVRMAEALTAIARRYLK